MPSYGLVDVKVATRRGNWTLAAPVNNVLDKGYFTHAVRSPTNPLIYNAIHLRGRVWKLQAGVKF